MASDGVVFNVASFIAGLFLLEYGADKFIDHTAIVAKRLNISPTLVGLLTCGAEWEELVVICVTLGQSQPSLALGNLMGSSIANILASFSLGLLFIRSTSFDRSSKIYTAALLALTSVFLVLLHILNPTLRWFAGAFLIAAFVFYVASVASLIYRGTLIAPESDSDDSNSAGDSESDGDDSSSDGSDSEDEERGHPRSTGLVDRGKLGSGFSKPASPRRRNKKVSKCRLTKPQPKPLYQHIVMLLLGLGALLVSSYIVAHSAGTIGSALGLSGTVVGTTILSLATTLPEKFVAVLGGVRKQPGIMVANTVGSNIFLITLCGGIVFLVGGAQQTEFDFTAFELMFMWLSSVLIFAVVMCGGRGWMGAAFLCMYILFFLVEVSHGRKLDDD